MPTSERSRIGLVAVIGAAALVLGVSGSGAQVQRDGDPVTIEIQPSDANATCQEEFLERAGGLRPGDTLVLRGGLYTQTCGRRLSNLHGAPGRPIVIRAAEGETPVLTRPVPPDHDYRHNNLEIHSSSYLTIRGLRLRGGSIGLKFRGPNRHIVLEGNDISGTANNALALNDGDTDGFVIRGNHIHDTGLLALSAGKTEGEGMYVGCNNGACIASNHLIERNYIHHLRGTSGGGNDGIEIKPGSHGITIRDNVIHDTNIGTRYPCIFVYGGGIRQNVVERNALWRCGEGIQAVSDVIVRNNVIANSDAGIVVAPHVQVSGMKNVAIVNNTLYGHAECLRARWAGAQNILLANNAIYCPGKTAVNAAGPGGPGKVIAANLIEGALVGVVRDELQFRYGGKASSTFAAAEALDFWPNPGSALIGAGLARLAPERDFNDRPRHGPSDVGAYQTNGLRANPGWLIAPRFKRAP